MKTGTVALGKHDALPEAGGLYAFMEGKEILYIGASRNLLKRCTTKGRIAYMRRMGATSIRFAVCEEAARRETAERITIITMSPKINRSHVVPRIVVDPEAKKLSRRFLAGCIRPSQWRLRLELMYALNPSIRFSHRQEASA